MAWDSSRPVPWRRLIKDWLLYLVIMTVFLIILKDNVSAGTAAGLLASGPLFVILGAVLAKFGYTRKTMKQLRAETRAKAAHQTKPSLAPSMGPRARPAPTKRTSTGSRNRPTSKRKR